MTPFSAPGAAAATPRAQGAPPTAAGAPRPMRGSYPYGNLGAAVRVAPSPTPRMPTAPGIPIAGPRMPHPQGAPNPGVPRPMVNLGGAPMSAPSPTPRMQAPGIPPNTRGVGAAVPSARPHMPLSQPTQRTPAVTAPSLHKRDATTLGPAPVQQAKRHAPMPRPQGAPTGGVPLPTNPSVGARAPAPPGHAQGAPTAGNATPSRPPPPQLTLYGVYHDPSKGWMARVVDPKRRVERAIGPFDAMHLAALAHDRVAVACAGRGISGAGARLNFETAFYGVETSFLQRWEGDVCEAVEKGEYEKTYAKFLKAGYRAALKVKPGDGGGEQIDDGEEGDELIASCYDAGLFWDTIVDFFLNRPMEIGEMALGKGGEPLRNRFVEMHRNKSLSPVWQRDNHTEKTMALQKQQHEKIQMTPQQQQHTQMQQQQQQQIQMQQQQQQQHQQQQIQSQQQQHHHQIQMQQQRQQQFRQQQMMIQRQRQQQQQTMMAQQQQQYLDDDATLQMKQEL